MFRIHTRSNLNQHSNTAIRRYQFSPGRGVDVHCRAKLVYQN